MKTLFLFFTICSLSLSCSQFSKSDGSPQSNSDAEKKAEQMNNDDIVPDGAAETPQNQNNQNKPKILSF